MQIKCEKDVKLVKLSDIKPLLNPKNSNRHPADQIDALVEQFKYQGIRHPIIISKRSGLVAAGEGRFLAAEKLNLTEYPVDYQDFESEEQEFAFGVADNAIASRAELDLSAIHKELPNLAPFDIDLLGIKDFQFEPEPAKEIDPEIEFSKELDEKNDYLVLLFDKKEDFKIACEKLAIKTVKYDLSPTQHEAFRHTGIGRVIEGKPVIDRL